MAEYKYRRGLEDVRELCSQRLSEAKGANLFHGGEYGRLPNGKKRDEHGTAIDVACEKIGAYNEIIMRIDLHLPKAQVKLPTEGSAQPAD